MGLNCMGPFIARFFSIVNTTVLHHQWLVESLNAEEPQKWRPTISYRGIFHLQRVGTLTPTLFKKQLYLVFVQTPDDFKFKSHRESRGGPKEL